MRPFAIICIGVLCLLSIFLYYNQRNEPVIQILTSEEIQRVITNDADHYYDKFHKMDFKVRSVKNKTKYLEKISKSGCTASDASVKKIKVCKCRD